MYDKYPNVQNVVSSGYTDQPVISFEDESDRNNHYIINLTVRNQNQIDLIARLASKRVSVLAQKSGESTEIYRGPYKSIISKEDIKDALEVLSEVKRNQVPSALEPVINPPSKNIRLLIANLAAEIETQIKQLSE